jgi:hypothetical protein
MTQPRQITNGKTKGVKPAVPWQAITTIVAFLLAYFPVDLPPSVAGAIAVVLGTGAGVAAPTGRIVSR